MRASLVVKCQWTCRWSALTASCQATSPRRGRPCLDAAVQALAGQSGELDLGDVQPRAVFGSVVDLQPLEREGIWGSKASYRDPMCGC